MKDVNTLCIACMNDKRETMRFVRTADFGRIHTLPSRTICARVRYSTESTGSERLSARADSELHISAGGILI